MDLPFMKLETLKPLSPRKQEILQAAQTLFSEKGYVAASMRDLAETLHIKPASLYSHYKSKEDMLWDIALRCAYAFLDRVLPMAEAHTSPEERLTQMVKAHVEVIIQNIEASAIFFREWRHLEPTRYQTYSGYIEAYEGAFSNVLEAGVASGVFRDVSTRFTTRMLLSAANWVHLWYQQDGPWKADRIANEISDFVLHGTMQSPD